MTTPRRGLVALVLLLSSVTATALTPQSMHFERLSIEDGLSQSNVKAIAQDHSGFLWFGTENGLNRYDGYRFRQYRRDRNADRTLENDFISSLALDHDGNLWIGTDGGGVARWNAARDDFTVLRYDGAKAGGIADDHVRAILADPRGWIWIGTRHNGLDRLDPNTGAVAHFGHDAGDPSTLSHDDIYDLALDANGMLWVATHRGLNQFDPESGTVVRYLHDPQNPRSLSQNVVQVLTADAEGTLWVGTSNGGLNRFDPMTGEFERYAHDPGDRSSLSSDRVQAIFEDADRRLWIGTAAGLNLMNREDGTFISYRHDATDASSLSSDNIVSLFQDQSGVLWVGTKIGGLSKWNPRSWSFGHVEPRPGEPGSLSSAHISSFTEDSEGNLWVGTFGGGINVLDSSLNAIAQLRENTGAGATLSDDRIMALITDAYGQIWVGTMGGGVNRIDPASNDVRVYRHDPADPRSLAADGIMSLYEDSKGRIWAGTFGGGVSRLDGRQGSFTNFAPDPDSAKSLSAGRATAIVEDRNGVIWVGTDGGGLNYHDAESGQWRRFYHDPDDALSLSANTIYALHVDPTGQLWVGTRAGLDRLVTEPTAGKPIGFQNITQRNGLANDTIYGIRSDRNGYLWLSTNFGLARYDAATGKIRNFHRSHGLQGEEFNFGAHFTNSRGELFFGGSNGFNAFDPASLQLDSRPPAVALTAFSKLNSPVQSPVPYERLQNVDLDYSDDVVTFEFSALDFVDPGQNRYAYMLEGFDKDWVDAGTERRITYTNLDGGHYVLRVRAANSDGVWSEQEVALPFHVAPPPWKTWWAYLAYLLLAGGALASFMRSQRRKLEREAEYSRRLETEVRDRTQELAERNHELRDANSRLHEASHTDALTGLRNRRYLFDEISKDIDLLLRHRSATPKGRRRSSNDDIVFIMVDLDHFKPVNDSMGHLAGDQMLLQVRDALLEASRSSDVVIRWGGDEFLVVARETNREDAMQLAERIRSRIAERVFSLGNGQIARTSSSIGFAAYPFLKDRPDLLDWEQVLGVADAAMYRAKELRNAWCGIYGHQWSGSADSFVAAVKKNAAALAEEGVIHIVNSVSLGDEEIA